MKTGNYRNIKVSKHHLHPSIYLILCLSINLSILLSISCHFGSYKLGKLRETRHKGRNSTVNQCQHFRAGQYKKCVQYDFKFTPVYLAIYLFNYSGILPIYPSIYLLSIYIILCLYIRLFIFSSKNLPLGLIYIYLPVFNIYTIYFPVFLSFYLYIYLFAFLSFFPSILLFLSIDLNFVT